MALVSSLESVTNMSLVFGCSADLCSTSDFETLQWFVSTQWMDLELNEAALASSREVFQYEGSERPRSVLDECGQR